MSRGTPDPITAASLGARVSVRTRVVRFVRAEIEESSRERCRAKVELERETGDVFGTAVEVDGPCSQLESLRLVAEATLIGLLRAVGERDDLLEVIGLSIGQNLGKETVVAAISNGGRTDRSELFGISVVGGDPITAASRAVLNATNRLLGTG